MKKKREKKGRSIWTINNVKEKESYRHWKRGSVDNKKNKKEIKRRKEKRKIQKYENGQ